VTGFEQGAHVEGHRSQVQRGTDQGVVEIEDTHSHGMARVHQSYDPGRCPGS
jgi:hypothetical protein